MKAQVPTGSGSEGGTANLAEPVEELVHRVAVSTSFEKAPRLRAFFLHVCRCAFDNQPEAATEQQIGIHVFGRPPGYNPSEDNIVRSQARMLRLKLEHHFADEGKDEPVIITIPKGQYLPVFEKRSEPPPVAPVKPRRWRRPLLIAGLGIVCGIAAIWLGDVLLRPKASPSPTIAPARQEQPAAGGAVAGQQAGLVPGVGEVRIAAGRTGPPYVDRWGRRWESDRYFEGGVAKAGPAVLFPPVPDSGLFLTMREAAASGYEAQESQRQFRYNIPLRPGVYELRLYFSDPARSTNAEAYQDAQNTRHFQITANGRPLLLGFDPIADAGYAAVDIRTFKDIAPAADGMLHLGFLPGPEPPFVNALELTPGAPGKLKPIRLCAQASDIVDADGTRWSGDNYFVHGRTTGYLNTPGGPKVPPRYTVERYGNFSYAIPVPPGSYTVKLHFLETFFSPLLAPSVCQGGCRVFDVYCNGVALLQDFDISEAADAFTPVVHTFHGLRPNGQGKLLLSFSSKVNYAEVRCIEVIDEAK